MKCVAKLLKVRAGPRPDPIPVDVSVPWKIHAPWVIALVALLTGAIFMDIRDLGLVATGAGLFAVTIHALQGRIRMACTALHFSGALLILSLFEGAEAAGSYALALGTVLVAMLAARTAATFLTPSVAPLAGRVEWRFADAYRHQALHFFVVGVMGSIALVIAGPTPVFRVLGIAILPLCLRVYSGHMLSPTSNQEVWTLVAAGHVLLALLLVPFYGAMAAAWIVVAGEITLFITSALIIADRTGVTPFVKPKVAASIGGVLLLAPMALPGAIGYVLVLLMAAGGGGWYYWPQIQDRIRQRATRSAADPSP